MQLLHLALQGLLELVGMAAVQLGQVQLAPALLQGLPMLHLLLCNLIQASIPLHHALQQGTVLPLCLLVYAAGAVNLVQKG